MFGKPGGLGLGGGLGGAGLGAGTGGLGMFGSQAGATPGGLFSGTFGGQSCDVSVAVLIQWVSMRATVLRNSIVGSSRHW